MTDPASIVLCGLYAVVALSAVGLVKIVVTDFCRPHRYPKPRNQ